MKHACKRLIAALALIPALSAFGGETPTAVRIGIVSFTQGGKPVFGGIPGRVIEEGWLEQELKKRGVTLEWQALPHANAGPQINEGFSNNSLDFAVRGDLPSVIALAGGVPGKLVSPVWQQEPAAVLTWICAIGSRRVVQILVEAELE